MTRAERNGSCGAGGSVSRSRPSPVSRSRASTPQRSRSPRSSTRRSSAKSSTPDTAACRWRDSGCSFSRTRCCAFCWPATPRRSTRCRSGGWRRRGSCRSASRSRPGLAGHAGSGEYTGLAIPADAIHVLAMACWLGGLVLLFAVVLSRTDPAELRQGIRRYSALALGSIVALGGHRRLPGVAPGGQLQRSARHGLREVADREARRVRRAHRRGRVQPRGREPSVPDAAGRRRRGRRRDRAAGGRVGSGVRRCRRTLREPDRAEWLLARDCVRQRELGWERPRRR